jgi:hypothetical protein
MKQKAIETMERIPMGNGDHDAGSPTVVLVAFSFGLPKPAKVLVTSEAKQVKL